MSKQHPSVAIIDPVGAKAGLDQYNLSLLQELKLLGCKVRLFSNFSNSAIEGENSSFFKFKEKQNLFSVLSLMNSYRKALNISKQNKIEYLIFHIFHFNYFDEWLLRKAFLSGYKIILIIHDVESFIFKPNADRLQRICGEYAFRLVVHNEFSKSELIKIFQPSVNKNVTVIPHGNYIALAKSKISKDKARTELGWDQNGKYVLFFGMIKQTKGLDVLLNALPKTNPSCKLVIAGRLRKHSFSIYNEIIRREKLTGRILLKIHHISNEERNLLFSAADLIVLPYRKIYQSGILLMAMSYGLPIIASRLPAMEEIIHHGENGYLFEAGNQNQLSEQINYLLGDPSLGKKLAGQAFSDSAKHHDWKSIAASFYSLFS